MYFVMSSIIFISTANSDGNDMNILNNKVKKGLLSGFYLCVSLTVISCASEPEQASLPKCDYTSHLNVNAQVRNFIWRDAQHVTFNENWQQSSLIQISNRYQYLQRKSLPDAVKAENDIQWLGSRLNNLQEINNGLLQQIDVHLCDNRQAPQSVSILTQQNAGIAYLLAGLPDILSDIQFKKQQIISAIESK